MKPERYYLLLLITWFDAAVSFAPPPRHGRCRQIALRQSDRSISTRTEKRSLLVEENNKTPWDYYQAQERIKSIPRQSPKVDDISVLDTTMITSTTFAADATLVNEQEYRRGLATIGFCTLVFASMSPVMHAALAGATTPPVLLLNAAVSVMALVGLVTSGPFLEQIVPKPSTLQEDENEAKLTKALLGTTARAGLELGLWKFLGTTANLYGLSMTTSDHGAMLIQLTTLIVPVVQGIMGVPIPQRIQVSVFLAMSGVVIFTQDHVSGAAVPPNQIVGDILCVVAAIFYATYDLRLFSWGRLVAARELITSKISTQALFSVLLLIGAGRTETLEYLSRPDAFSPVLFGLILWSGFMVNAIVPFLQVGGQQAIGPTRSQTIYASQPLWAATMSFVFLGETIGLNGAIGGTAFLAALFLAATAEASSLICSNDNCDV